jgi:hypothetical protein
VNPGESGFALAWIGDTNVPIELLDKDCNVLGVFESSDGVEYTVKGVDGIVGSIRKYQISHPPAETLAGSSQCGGLIEM